MVNPNLEKLPYNVGKQKTRYWTGLMWSSFV